MDDEDQEYESLVTRFSIYKRLQDDFSSDTTSTPVRKVNNRGNYFLLCIHHNKLTADCSSCFTVNPTEKLPNGRLPTKKQVIAYTLWKNKNNLGTNNLTEVCSDIMLQWISCNVYTLTRRSVQTKLETLMKTYYELRKYPKKKRGETYQSRLKLFTSECEGIFDIKCIDHIRIKDQQQKWGVKQTEADVEFYKNQCLVPQVGYCTTHVDRKWIKSSNRKRKAEERFTLSNLSDILDIAEETCNRGKMISDTEIENNIEIENDTDYLPEESEGKCFNKFIKCTSDGMPEQYQFIRKGERKVKPEIYSVMHKLASEYHMSKAQIEGSIVTIGNMLFGREWKSYSANQTSDLNTLPSMKNLLHTEPNFEAMALCAIVEEIMKDDSTAAVMYSNDGSSMSGVGAYVVQSLTIDGVQRCLPTMGIFTESRESLKDLEIITLKILAASCGHKYSEQDILRKISFVMTDSTSHNLNVIEKVCEELNVDESPRTLLCNIHPLMMFQSKMKQLCQEIHDSLGSRKIKECFLVDVEFAKESFVIKSLKCLSNFINRDYSSKPWNRSGHFEQFIKPKENKSLSLKDHRFNRLNDCALRTLHHIEDIAKYLDEYANIINGISILDRSFVEMEVLKPIYAAIALLGIHILKPFYCLLMNPETNYSLLLTAFPKLYAELSTIKGNQLLTTDQVFFFVSETTYQSSLPDNDLLNTINDCCENYPSEIASLISLCLEKFASGFAHQKGAIFGFSDKSNDNTGTVLKISDLDDSSLKNLNNVPVHNIGEERSVGLFNYEISLRGKKNVDAASRKMIINKSSDLIFESTSNFKSFRTQANEIKEIKLTWNKKMKELQEKGYSEKLLLNIKMENQKFVDLEFLQKQQPIGPFTKSEQVKIFLESQPENKEKNHRMYIEIRFQKNTSTSIKWDAAVFRLKKDGKNLPTEDYGFNLIQYLDQSRSIGNLSMGDLRNVLNGLQGKCDDSSSVPQLTPVSHQICEQNESFVHGETVASVWHDDIGDNLNWYLGVIDKIDENGIYVSYMKRSDKNGLSWLFPDSADIQFTSVDQIIARNIQVAYSLTAIIRCKIDTNTLETIQKSFENVIKISK